MYRTEKLNPALFPKLFHLGSKLDHGNRWLKLAELLPWEQWDELYGRYFAPGQGRPAKDSRLVCGLLVVKLVKNLSDEEAVREFMENPYIQAFCGCEYFAVEDVLSPHILSERRKRLGREFFDAFDSETARILKEAKFFRIKTPRDPGPAGLIGTILNKIKTICCKN